MIKRWSELVPDGHAFHLSVGLDERRMPVSVHGHDFAEVSWVVEGTGWHRINGKRLRLRTGDLVFIRPTDRHGLSVDRDERFRLENVGLTIASLQRLRTTYFSDATDRFWSEDPLPHRIILDAGQVKRLEGELEWLRHAPRDVFSLDCFLLQLFRVIGERQASPDFLPEWLDGAMRRFRGRDLLGEGLPGFLRLAGRSPGHVCRVMRDTCGVRPSEWVNQNRVEYAARLLEGSRMPVTEIAAEVGFENLSYFHRLFHARYGTSPLRYRKRLVAVL